MRILIRALASVLLVVLSSTCLFSQRGDSAPCASQCDYVELFRKDGWDIPGIKNATIKGARAAIPDHPDVYLTVLEPATRVSTIQSFRCSREHSGRLEVEDVEIGIVALSSYDVGGRVFAYNLTYGVDGVAAQWSVTFYDLDGSGQFRLRRSQARGFAPELIPDWVRGLGAPRSGRVVRP